MTYRTKTYIAAEWEGENDAIEQLKKWNNSNFWSLHFTDAHDLTQARDSSLNCSIKSSLKKRLNSSKTFVLIVGQNTINVRSGSCAYCKEYNIQEKYCKRGYAVDLKSYIAYKCHTAVKDGLKIIVLYNAAKVNKNKCPECLKTIGKHIAMKNIKNGKHEWDYQSVKDAFDN